MESLADDLRKKMVYQQGSTTHIGRSSVKQMREACQKCSCLKEKQKPSLLL